MFSDLSSPFTGGAQTGFTSPTYDWVADSAPDSNGEQVAIDTIGGTQTNVVAHSVSIPFTLTVQRPKNFKVLGAVNPVTGQLTSVPKNVYKWRTRKGVIPLSGQAASICMIETTISVPAGSDSADPNNVLAAISAHIGSLSDKSAGVGALVLSGVLG